jgi:hypothetical protein
MPDLPIGVALDVARVSTEDHLRHEIHSFYARHAPAIEDEQPVGACPRESGVVGRHDDRAAVGRKAAQGHGQIVAARMVERCGRLVHQQHLWIDSKRTGDCDALCLPA